MVEDIKKTLWATADKLRANMDEGTAGLGRFAVSQGRSLKAFQEMEPGRWLLAQANGKRETFLHLALSY
jgi:hypothetical protein